MIEFILNNKLIRTRVKPGSILLDFIRENQKLKGTKIGCREGDCGACTVLSGSLQKDGSVNYNSIVSCLTPLGNIAGKHIVTIEGINTERISPIQEIFVKENATQCGFCTPGFIVSLAGFSLAGDYDTEKGIASVSGNICRCTGYKSIERAISEITEALKKIKSAHNLQALIDNDYLPEYFKDIARRLKEIQIEQNKNTGKIVAGGTDLYVQQADDLQEQDIRLINKAENHIKTKNNICTIDSTCTVSELEDSTVLNRIIPNWKKFIKLISSKQIRNMATLGGNFVNASPIGDLSIIFIALDAKLNIKNTQNKFRKIKLKDFFIDYKKIDLREGEIIETIEFEIPQKPFNFNFEKVSKRTHLDIASVNTAILIKLEENCIREIYLSAGGVAPIPYLLAKTEDFLLAKELNTENIRKASEILLNEILPISDIRGSKEYKSLLLRQLFFKHFITLFPKKIQLKDIHHA
ncbi:MAG: FAD binding domain-containing protein [Bacteroidales bacterium]|nr:FAD binding domain-containing protein [Bacteroidales bacterium]